jgi:putative methionine-R-sulfoxide reductase with GAF domain
MSEPGNLPLIPPTPFGEPEAHQPAKRSVFRNLMLAMIGFGILVGLVFPPFARLVLGTPRALSLVFFGMCILAGFLVGFVNYQLFRRVVSRELTSLATDMERVLTRVMNESNLSQRDLKEFQLEITSRDAIGEIQAAFNGMSQAIARRARALQTSAQVSRQLSTILDEKLLVREVVEQLKAAFNYYHAHIYLFDAAHENLVMKGGTGEAGQALLAKGHHLPRGKGLVGRAAETNAPVLVPDTAQDPGWLPNPLLPETKSEVAVPIAVGNQVQGVLDVQHNVRNGLQEADAILIQTIANQVAIALQNAQAYGRADENARREQFLGTAAQEIQSAATVDEVLQLAVRKLGQALSTRRACVEITSPFQSRDNPVEISDAAFSQS